MAKGERGWAVEPGVGAFSPLLNLNHHPAAFQALAERNGAKPIAHKGHAIKHPPHYMGGGFRL